MKLIDRDMSALNGMIRSMQKSGGFLEFLTPDGWHSVGFSKMYEDVMQVAQWMRSLGIQPLDRVGIIGSNIPDVVSVDLACIALGATTVHLSIEDSQTNAEWPPRSYGVKCLFCEAAAMSRSVPSYELKNAFLAAKQLALAAAGPSIEPYQYRHEDPFTYKFTSGTTGLPKILVAMAQSIEDALCSVQELFQHGPGDTILVFLPLSVVQQRYWVYSAILNQHGITLSNWPLAIAALRQRQPTVVMGVPAFYQTIQSMLVDCAPDAIKEHLLRYMGADSEAPIDPATNEYVKGALGGRIHYLWTGSAPAATGLVAFFTKLGVPMYEGYGLNEAPITSKNYPDATRIGSVGRLLPNREVRFGADGEIFVRHRYPAATGYMGVSSEENKKTFLPDGYTATGDIGRMDKDEFLYILGRKKELIVLPNGRKLNPLERERQLISTGKIAECIVFHASGDSLVTVVRPVEGVTSHQVIHVLRDDSQARRADERIRKALVVDQPLIEAAGVKRHALKIPRREMEAAFGRLLHKFFNLKL